jgi:hypothetical protein
MSVRTLLLLVSATAAYAQSPSAAAVWDPVRPLLGRWEGSAEGRPGTGKATREYRFVLNQRYIEIRNQSAYPAQPKNPKGEVHEDWGMISFDRVRKKLVLRQFHIEGFVNQYVQESTADGRLVFVSESIENIPAGFRARETYTFAGPDEFTERFELAEPGKDFEPYSTTRFRRARP